MFYRPSEPLPVCWRDMMPGRGRAVVVVVAGCSSWGSMSGGSNV